MQPGHRSIRAMKDTLNHKLQRTNKFRIQRTLDQLAREANGSRSGVSVQAYQKSETLQTATYPGLPEAPQDVHCGTKFWEDSSCFRASVFDTRITPK